MASVLEADLIDGAALEERNGVLTATRAFMVTDIEGDRSEIGKKALEADGVPIYGAFHPKLPNLRATDRIPFILSPTQAKVMIGYKLWRLQDQRGALGAPPKIRISASLQSMETNQDVFGKQITIDFTKPGIDDSGNRYDIDMPTQGGLVSIQVPQLVVEAQTVERESPFKKSRRYLGKVNNDTFQGDPPYTWLCSRLDGDTTDGGLTYNVVYEFRRAIDTWDTTVVYQEEGQPAAGTTDGNGRKSIRIYESEQFGVLGLGEF